MLPTHVIICSGIHDFVLTEQFLIHLQHCFSDNYCLNYLIFPTDLYPAYSSFHLHQFIQKNIIHLSNTPLLFMAFSAGVVAAISTALSLHQNHQNVQALIAFDGWGVPLWTPFPIHRVSHDYFTHWSSSLLGSGQINFYADPDVDHLDIWRIPNQVKGLKIETVGMGNYMIKPIRLIDFIKELLVSYQ